MTVCGLNCIDAEHGFAWADSEAYLDSEPSGVHVCKISINALAGVVGVGSGRLPMITGAAGGVLAAASFDDVVATLPAILRDARAIAGASARSTGLGAAYGIVGHSARFGRTVAMVFSSENRFAGELCRSWASPWVAPGAFAVNDEYDALEIACMQLREVQSTMPNATGGTLCIATLAGGVITARAAFDMRTRSRPGRAHDVAGRGGAS